MMWLRFKDVFRVSVTTAGPLRLWSGVSDMTHRIPSCFCSFNAGGQCDNVRLDVSLLSLISFQLRRGL